MNKPVKRRPRGKERSSPAQHEKDPANAAPFEKRVDGRFEINLSEDRMRAFISLSSSRGGGAPLSVEKVKKSLAELKIVFGVNDELLKRLIENVERTKDEKRGVIIAQGLAPEEGKEGIVRYHIKGRGKDAGKVEGRGGAGRDRIPVMTAKAKKGDILATVVKSVPGRDGKDVLGNPVPSPSVRDPKLLAGRNIRVEKGSLYYMGVDGIVEVFEDENGVRTVSGCPCSDGEFSIRILDGDMEVLIDVRPSLGGGKPVYPSGVLHECKSQGVVVAVDEAKVRDAVDKAEKEHVPVENVLIARGEPPVHGKDGSVKFPLRFATGSRLSRLEDGSVDFKEQDIFTTVEKGTIVAEITEPEGAVRDGVTVKGRTVEAKNGREVTLVAGSNTLVEKREGYSRFIAAIDGRFFCDGRSVSVEPVMLIEGDAGPETGNVRFNGVVEIAGDVLDGYRVYGKKGVIVRGNVGNAEVKSEKNVTILCGVLGKGCGVVSAGGDITVKFAENARLEARGDIVVHRAAMNCSMLSGGRIAAVKEKGQLVGGELKARLGVVAKTLGNDSEHRMEIFAGSDFFVERTLHETRRRLERCVRETRAFDLAPEKAPRGGRLSDRNPDRSGQRGAVQPAGPLKPDSGEPQQFRTSLLAEAEELKRVESECLLKLDEVFDAQVAAQDTLFRGVRVHFGKNVYEPDGSRTKVKITYDRERHRINTCRM
jgi:uncharacterized protein (DUF342 family)